MQSKGWLGLVPIFLFILFGVIGNVINIVVFAQRRMRQTSTFRYLLYLSISDLFVVLFSATEVLIKSNLSHEIREFSIFPCNVQKFLTYSTNYVSSCLSIAVSIEKALIVSRISSDLFESSQSSQDKEESRTSFKAMRHKCSTRSLVNRQRNSLVDRNAAAIVITIMLVNSHFIFLMKPTSIFRFHDQEHEYGARENGSSEYDIINCLPVKELFYDEFLVNIWSWVDFCLYSILPFSFMTVCSVIIIVKLKKINEIYVSLLGSSVFNRAIYLKKLKRNFQASLMLVTTSSYFLFSMLIFWIWFFCSRGRMESVESSPVQTLVYMLLYANNAFDILFYSMSSQKFRTELFNLLGARDST